MKDRFGGFFSSKNRAKHPVNERNRLAELRRQDKKFQPIHPPPFHRGLDWQYLAGLFLRDFGFNDGEKTGDLTASAWAERGVFAEIDDDLR